MSDAYDHLTDEQLAAMDAAPVDESPVDDALSADAATTADTTAQDPARETPAPQPTTTEAQAQTEADATKAGLTKALIEQRHRAQAAEAALAQQRHEQAQAQAQAKAEQAQQDHERAVAYHAELMETDPAEAERFADQYNAREAQKQAQTAREAQAQAETTAARIRLETFGKAYRATVGQAFDDAYNRVCATFGTDWTDAQCEKAPDPGKWVMDFERDHMAPSPAALEKMVNEKVKQQLKEIAAKHAPPPQRGHNSVGHVSSSSPDPGHAYSDRELASMSDSQLADLERETHTRRR